MSVEQDEETRAAIEHRDALIDIRAVLDTPAGKRFFKYLLKNLDVGEIPEYGLEGNLLMDRIGFLRAGNSIYKLACESNCMVTGTLLAEIEKEKYDRLYRQSRG